jgi:hypothetical protein
LRSSLDYLTAVSKELETDLQSTWTNGDGFIS